MPRLLRPHIPLEVRCRVVLRQLGELFIDIVIKEHRFVPRTTIGDSHGLCHLLNSRLWQLAKLLGCDSKDLRLDHDPALAVREKVMRNGVHVGYRPDANDPEYLIYRTKSDHHIKTNVRGDGAQHSDRVLIKRARKKLRKPRPKKRWPSRPFQKRKI